ncbi:MAG: alpha/beta fold hydrolase [Caulobacteraceae bacterium]|nr:alpha/beta fold hydrolase [Caulobacteraceae bacterium]
MDVVRTPEDRFSRLDGFPWTPTWLDDLPGFAGLRAAVVDEGPRNADRTFLCLHGEPTWSYLYRKMIPVFLASGARVVAPDFFGFGRSDKPVNDDDYSFHFHRNFLLRLIERLDLRRIVLVVQDWGGLLGLTLPADEGARARISGLVVMNTALAVGEPLTPGFDAWRAYAATQPDLAVGALVRRGANVLSDAEAAAYDAPFPDAQYKAGVRAFPRLVMTSPEMQGVPESRAARDFWANRWHGRAFMACGGADPVFPLDHMEALRRQIRGCPEPMVVPQAGHFVQEWGEPIARRALEVLSAP